MECRNGNWNAGALISRTTGGLYLIMTDDGNEAVLLEVRVDKMGINNVHMLQEREGTKSFNLNGTTFKAGAGGHVTADGVLSLFATEFYNDHANIRYDRINVNTP